MVQLKLELGDAVTLKIEQDEKKTMIFTHLGECFQIKSSWSKKLIPMQEAAEGVFEAIVTLTPVEWPTFQILKDEDEYQMIHPEMELANLEQSKAMGPDHQGEGLAWYIDGHSPSSMLTIRLDLTQTDKRQMVTWQAKSTESQALGN